MFYSETLLSKTGPLARVWLAANLERKLSKSNILQSDIESSVSAIVDQGQAPMALRLSGQLLLGVVRIYSRKARYLLDDCNEALIKIKMAFRPGNVDLPANQSQIANPATLTLPDVITELDLFAPMPDPSLLFSQSLHLEPASSNPELLRTDSSVALNNIEQLRNDSKEALMLEDDDLELDLGEDPIDPQSDRSIEIPRKATTPRALEQGIADEPVKLYDDNLHIDVGEDPISDQSYGRERNSADGLGDITMGDVNLSDIQAPEEISEVQNQIAVGQAEVSAQSPTSPLSSIRSSMERDLERSIGEARESSLFQPLDEAVIGRNSLKAKKRKAVLTDVDTMIHQSQMKAQQSDRSKILMPSSFLPRDSALLALMTMQKNGSFVSNIMGDGRSQGWAPELRGILSVEVVKNSGKLKRKRDDGISGNVDNHANENFVSSPEQVQNNMNYENLAVIRRSSNASVEIDERLSVEVGDQPYTNDDFQILDDDRPSAIEDQHSLVKKAYNDTTMPLPFSNSESIALGTRHAVHLLRENFGLSTKKSTIQNRKPKLLFHDMLPEKRMNRADATKMFFEILVLATKDAIKVDQASDTLCGPISLEEKKGLWGDWAETQARAQSRANDIDPSKAIMSPS